LFAFWGYIQRTARKKNMLTAVCDYLLAGQAKRQPGVAGIGENIFGFAARKIKCARIANSLPDRQGDRLGRRVTPAT
jgi:hypothetical protein